MTSLADLGLYQFSASMTWLNKKHILFPDIPSHRATLQFARSQELDTSKTNKTEVWRETKASWTKKASITAHILVKVAMLSAMLFSF